MAMQMVAIPEEMLRLGSLTTKHLELYAEISREPDLSYQDLAQRLGRTVKTIRRLEDDLIAAEFIDVSYKRLPKGKQQIQRAIIDRQTRALERAS